MEKIVVSEGFRELEGIAEEVNEYLEAGWTVKFVTCATSQQDTATIFVLEKKSS